MKKEDRTIGIHDVGYGGMPDMDFDPKAALKGLIIMILVCVFVAWLFSR